MKLKTALLGLGVAAIAAALLLSVKSGSAQQTIDPADYSATITNPLFPLSSLGPKVFKGEEIDEETGETIKTRLDSVVLPDKTVVAGVTVTVLEEKAYNDGELIETALDYFAQHKNGDVYYFGERVDNFENGQLKDHDGQWLAGENGNLPGILMPASPEVGKTYNQENAPGVAEDKSTVISVTETVTTPAGTYSDCMKTKDFTPLEPGIEEFKWFCPGIGMVQEEGDASISKLVSIGAAPTPPPAATPTTAAAAPTAAPPPTGVTAPNTGDGPAASSTSTGAWFVAMAALAVAQSGALLAGWRTHRDRIR